MPKEPIPGILEAFKQLKKANDNFAIAFQKAVKKHPELLKFLDENYEPPEPTACEICGQPSEGQERCPSCALTKAKFDAELSGDDSPVLKHIGQMYMDGQE